jgi:phage host-nuclease inhibitor protein Gam
MALSKQTIEDKIEIVGDFKHIQIRTKTAVMEDGVELSASFHRHTLAPNDDISGQSAEVQAVCNAVWTDELKGAFEAHVSASEVI